MDTHKVSASSCPDASCPLWSPVMNSNGVMSRYLSDFNEIRRLGTGGFGTVVRCQSKIDHSVYAVKQISLLLTSSVEREVVALSRLNHPNIVRYHTSWYESSPAGKFVEPAQSGPTLFIQMECCEMSLAKKRSDIKAWGDDPDRKWRIFYQILLGLSHIHEKNIIHGDLCSENIFLDENDNPKIGDFGLVEILEDKEMGRSSSNRDGNKFFQAPECTPTYLERSSSSEITKKSDIYSVGLILADIGYTSKEESRKEILQRVRNGDSVLFMYSSRELEIIRQTVIKEPKERLEILQIIDLLPKSQLTAKMAPKPHLPVPHMPGLPIDLKGKRAFVNHIVDDKCFGWAIAKSLAAAGAEIFVGVPIDALDRFTANFDGKIFDKSRKLPDDTSLEFKKVYGLNASYGAPEDVPVEDVPFEVFGENSNYTVMEVFESLHREFGKIDILVQSKFEFPEYIKSFEEISKSSYIDDICETGYSLVALAKYAVPIMNPDGSIISLTYNGSQKIIPACGLGMSSSLAASENVVRMLAYDVGRKRNIRVNAVSVGLVEEHGLKRRKVARQMINYSWENAPLKKELTPEEVGNATAFLASPLASAITGSVIYVDNGLHSMGVIPPQSRV